MSKHNKTIIIVQGGVCAEVWSTVATDIEVIDLDGDYRDEGEKRRDELQAAAAKHDRPAFDQIYP